MPYRKRQTRVSKARADRPRKSRNASPAPVPHAPFDGASEAATMRLSLYLRALARCQADGRLLVSSEGLAASTGCKPALVRKDLARFGQFGIRGVGYEVGTLRTRITRILGLDRDLNVVIVGAGNLGMALADYRGFNTGGIRTIALFDVDAAKVGQQSRGGVPVRPMKELAALVRKDGVGVAVLAVPLGAAQEVLDQVVAAGVRAVLNFAPARLKAKRGVHVRSVDLKVHLEGLAYMLTRPAARGKSVQRPRGG